MPRRRTTRQPATSAGTSVQRILQLGEARLPVLDPLAARSEQPFELLPRSPALRNVLSLLVIGRRRLRGALCRRGLRAFPGGRRRRRCQDLRRADAARDRLVGELPSPALVPALVRLRVRQRQCEAEQHERGGDPHGRCRGSKRSILPAPPVRGRPPGPPGGTPARPNAPPGSPRGAARTPPPRWGVP